MTSLGKRLRARRRFLLAFALLLAAVAVGSFLIGDSQSGVVQSQGDGAGGEAVRVQARTHADGRVEVGVQQRGDEGWGETLLPEHRFLPADAPFDHWLASSGVALADGGGTGSHLCMIDHGSDEDQFWLLLHRAAIGAAKNIGAHLEIHSGLGEGGMAAAIRQCTADGADAVAVTLADADAVAEAIAEANEAGVGVITFNSGSHLAEAVGSAIHVGPPDFAGGVQAGEEFNKRGVEGLIICLIHEGDNSGLHERCDGLAAGYTGGAVEPLVILADWPDGALEDVAAQLLARRYDAAQETPAAWLALNGEVVSTLTFINFFEDNTPFELYAGFGFTGSAIPDTIFGSSQFFLWDSPLEQGYQTVMAMQYILNLSPSFPNVTIGQIPRGIGTIFLDIPAIVFGQREALFLGQHLQIDGEFLPLELQRQLIIPPGN